MGGSAVHHAVSGNERQRRTSCHQCMKLVLLITMLGVLYTGLEEGAEPQSVTKFYIHSC